MAKTIYEVLEELRAASTSEADKGSRLERLFRAFLLLDPVYAEQFSDVWLWNDWPGRDGKHDTGIDLVAKMRDTGDLVAIQCKFYAPTSTVSKDDIDSFLAASGKHGFAQRIIVSTTDKWNAHAEAEIHDQQIPVRRIGLSDLENSRIDWSHFSPAKPEVLISLPAKHLRPHQAEAVEKCAVGFESSDRGKLIMACGTGKTFTSLRLAEQLAGAGGTVLFLVPSISLLSQTLREWSSEALVPLRPLAVCSDRKATTKAVGNEDISTVDLALPATTNVPVLVERLKDSAADDSGMTVVFSTYQSVAVVAEAQKAAGLAPFDLIICDEAHRTTGATLAGEDESAFVKVHDDEFLGGTRRLYMTATPRIYDDSSKAKAGEMDVVLASMDDSELYGPEFYRLGFGEAVARDLLTDYKVLVLAVDETAVARTFQMQLSADGELRLDDAAKIVGCWNGLAKRGHAEHSFTIDPTPMRRAVAFAGTIKDSKKITDLFAGIVDQYTAGHQGDGADDTEVPVLSCQVQHVDGSYNALARNALLDWLKADVPDGHCRILSNARCLSEGVDVPALDAVMFLSPRKSVVDVVQSVGRVMRKAPGKKYGYIILPVGIPENLTPEQALRDNKRYAAVWEVLQALRAHDERFDAMINRIDLTSTRDDKINVIGVGGDRVDTDDKGTPQVLGINLATLDEWRDAVYAKIVAKVGSRRYWEDWAADVADLAQRHITRITALLDDPNTAVGDAFANFLDGLRGNLNESITQADAIEMLAQHLITRPVFEALFGGYDFTAHNPVAQTMEAMLAALDEHSLDTENESLAKFYESVRMRVAGIDTAEGRQEIIRQLYDTFFATAFRRSVAKLGIAYTPVEVVDFIIRSADWALRQSFGQGLTDEGVHILDGFTGTGTFMVRLLQSGLITSHDLARKYATELHANEILLLAYYIAAVNIETAYQDLRTGHVEGAGYEPFPGLILTDTFQSWEDDDRPDLDVFPENNERLENLKKLDITVILGNPPWSAGQDSANDNNQNEQYPTLDASIADTYAKRSTATNKNSLYDLYIRAIRWATLRIKNRGLIAFVTNGGWLDSNTADGMRKTLADEFSAIWVYNLRGNQRTAGDESRREGGKIFGAGSRATVAITVLVKDPHATGTPTIHYADIGDYLSREDKLRIIAGNGSIGALETVDITPNAAGDWLRQRSSEFVSFLPLGTRDGGEPRVFSLHGRGLETGRDAWVYSYGRRQLETSMRQTIQTYGAALAQARKGGEITNDPKLISWTSTLRTALSRGRESTFEVDAIHKAAYRPYTKHSVYLDPMWIHRPGVSRSAYPSGAEANVGIMLTGAASHYDFCCIAVDQVPDLHLLDTGQFFARWRYEPADEPEGMFASVDGETVGGYRRVDNITDKALDQFQKAYGDKISKEDIFYYVYGLLHSPDYRNRYADDLKKMLPHIPLVADAQPFIDGGGMLADLHVNYESVFPYSLDGLKAAPPAGADLYEHYRVEKMRFASKSDRSTVVYNPNITLRGIPDEAYRYKLGARSAIEWIIDRYQVKVDKASGIRNDPNDWSREVGNPRYILDLLARIVTLSIETMKIVDALPALDIRRV